MSESRLGLRPLPPNLPPPMGRPRKKKPAARKVAPSTVAKLRRLAEETLALQREADEAEAQLAAFRERDEPAFTRWVEESFPDLRTEFESLSHELLVENALHRSLDHLCVLGERPSETQAEELRADIRRTIEEEDQEDDATPFDDFDSDVADDRGTPREGESGPFAGGAGAPGPGGGAYPSDAVADPAAGSALASAGYPFNSEDGVEAFFDDLPPGFLDDLFEEFFYATRGIDPADTDSATRQRAEAEFRRAFASLYAGDGERGLEQLLRAAANASPARLAEIKSLYRSLTRSLHPDRTETFEEGEKRLWDEIQTAYRCLDLEGLRAADVRLHLHRGEEVPPAKAPVLREMNRSLQNLREWQRKELTEAREHPAWRFTNKRGLVALAKRVRADLEEAVSEFREELTFVRDEIARMIRPSRRKAAAKKTPRKRAPDTKSRSKATRSPDPESPVQLEFPF